MRLSSTFTQTFESVVVAPMIETPLHCDKVASKECPEAASRAFRDNQPWNLRDSPTVAFVNTGWTLGLREFCLDCVEQADGTYDGNREEIPRR